MANVAYQILTLFILHRIQYILEECFYKKNLRHKILNEVLNVITHIVSDHDSLSLKHHKQMLLQGGFDKTPFQTHDTWLLIFVFVYI